MATFFIVEASHLFRAGDKHQTQFYVLDVVKMLQHLYFPDANSQTIVLHGSTKEEQAQRYASALTRHGVKVIRMTPIPSLNGSDKHFYKPTWYVHHLMGKDIPVGSSIVLVGFHNPRYLAFIQKYATDFKISIAAFTTPSRRQGWLKVPDAFKPFLDKVVDLDQHVADIKNEWKKKK